jgi:hypothetical protein
MVRIKRFCLNAEPCLTRSGSRRMNITNKSFLRIVSWLLLLLLLLFAISLSRGPAEHLWLDAPGWSRARLVGYAQINQAASIALDDTGGIYLLLIRADGEMLHPQGVALDRQAEIVWKHTFEAALTEPLEPQILWVGKELELFWISDRNLYTARLDTLGNVQSLPTLISGGMAIGSYDATQDASGSVTVWYGGTRREPGIYALPPGDPSGEATLVDRAGVQPVVRYDGQGTLHAAWVTYPPPEQGGRRIYYAAYPNGLYRPEQQILLVEPELRVNSTWQGPWLGLDRGHGYLFWTEVASSARGPALNTEYVYFPLNEAQLVSEPASIVVPSSNDLLYETLVDGGLDAGLRVSLRQHPGAVSPWGIAVNPAVEQELVLASRTQVQYRYGSVVGQINTLFFQDGVPTAYQLLSFTSGASFTPAIVSDKVGQLYVTWLERADVPGFAVYFASTAPDIQRALSSVTRSDVGRMAVEAIFGLLMGVMLTPVAALLWLLAPASVLALTWIIRRGGESLANLGARISLGAAMIAYWVVKLTTLAGARAYVPFSAWIPIIPSWLEGPLQAGVPIVTTLVALGIARRFALRSETRSAALCMVVYTAIDSALTMAVYGGLFYDAF